MGKSEAKERVDKIRKRKRQADVALIFNIIFCISFCAIGLFNFSSGVALKSSLVIGALFLALALTTWDHIKTVKAYESYISELRANAARSKRADNQESE